MRFSHLRNLYLGGFHLDNFSALNAYQPVFLKVNQFRGSGQCPMVTPFAFCLASKTYDSQTTPKYDIGRKEFGKEPSHFRLWWGIPFRIRSNLQDEGNPCNSCVENIWTVFKGKLLSFSPKNILRKRSFLKFKWWTLYNQKATISQKFHSN